jgi:diketogulonate reductase-like aldo/keto reductase
VDNNDGIRPDEKKTGETGFRIRETRHSGDIMIEFTAYNQIALPSFIYGTAWKKEATARLVQSAVESGFRGIDTANQPVHYNEPAAGEALKALAGKGIERETLFLQTKFTPVGGHDHRVPYDASADLMTQVNQSFARSLQHLGTETVDSYLLHGPYSRGGLGAEDREVWGALEGIHRSGRARLIGISNVSAGQLAQLCELATVKPMVVQNRCFAVLGWDQAVRAVCREHRIVYQGFSLLTANQGILGHPGLHAIARRVGSGPLQVIFRFALQIGILPLTGTTSEQHMKEDLQVGQFELTDEEVGFIETIAI